jgi:hypothetical protein
LTILPKPPSATSFLSKKQALAQTNFAIIAVKSTTAKPKVLKNVSNLLFSFRKEKSKEQE